MKKWHTVKDIAGYLSLTESAIYAQIADARGIGRAFITHKKSEMLVVDWRDAKKYIKAKKELS